MTRKPGLQAEEVGGEVFLPRATMPPVRVTLGEEITFAGSDRPEMITAWMLEGAIPGE